MGRNETWLPYFSQQKFSEWTTYLMMKYTYKILKPSDLKDNTWSSERQHKSSKMPFHFKQLCLELLILLRIKEESNMTSFIYLLIYDCAGSSMLHKDFLQLWWAGATFHCNAWVSHYGDFSCCRPSALGTRASVAAVFRFSSCGTWAFAATQHVGSPQIRMEPIYPALAGGFSNTEPPGKSKMTSWDTYQHMKEETKVHRITKFLPEVSWI